MLESNRTRAAWSRGCLSLDTVFSKPRGCLTQSRARLTFVERRTQTTVLHPHHRDLSLCADSFLIRARLPSGRRAPTSPPDCRRRTPPPLSEAFSQTVRFRLRMERVRRASARAGRHVYTRQVSGGLGAAASHREQCKVLSSKELSKTDLLTPEKGQGGLPFLTATLTVTYSFWSLGMARGGGAS